MHARGSLTDRAYEVLERELSSRGLAVPERPRPERLEIEARSRYARTTLAGHWQGKATLASAYWLLGTLGFWAVYGAILLTKSFIPALMPLAVVVAVVFLVFAWVSIWRCWRNAGWPLWGYLARGMVVLHVIVVVAVAALVISDWMQPQSIVR